MKTQMIEVSVIAALVGLGILVYYIYRKSKRKEQPEVQDVEWRIRTANRRADAAGERATEWRILAAPAPSRRSRRTSPSFRYRRSKAEIQ